MQGDLALAAKWYSAAMVLSAVILAVGFHLMALGRGWRAILLRKWGLIYFVFFLGYVWMEVGLFSHLSMAGLRVGENTVYLDGILEGRIPLAMKLHVAASIFAPPVVFVVFATIVEICERRTQARSGVQEQR